MAEETGQVVRCEETTRTSTERRLMVGDEILYSYTTEGNDSSTTTKDFDQPLDVFLLKDRLRQHEDYQQRLGQHPIPHLFKLMGDTVGVLIGLDVGISNHGYNWLGAVITAGSIIGGTHFMSHMLIRRERKRENPEINKVAGRIALLRSVIKNQEERYPTGLNTDSSSNPAM